ncbi:hypothetical protein HMPREF3086_10730 [Dietzia sp. HMSC21D01]|uniref:Uncharacterized protein n=1 Tax=Dietzia cinnamea TaxID=321318 RepID=A0AAW5Q8D9_9ACTN|nr:MULTISPECIES: hypothetical protein [Dietzia]MCT1865606.1 hypothetical protein [Dietzia cinnamea]MCT2031622.1 hypothetical protein [Dietzia cinnamea]MCT2034576.1 hypothetical protein [Dietzia cinnamea]MCT2076223.1 hypothetical protein [Dietzia cinnamea]MCT2107811.1 hypothetical protein [Dietzia cinnamea]
MLRPLFLTRASIGLAATAAERVVALPGRAIEAVSTLPGVPVRVAGGLVQSYLHAGQTLTDLAVKGDRVLASVFPARSDQPEWATFDEDQTEEVLDVSYRVYGSSRAPRGGGDDDDDPDVPTGRVTPRDA